MTSWQIIRVFAGSLILVSLALGVQQSPFFMSSYWLWLTALVGANLLQSGFTGWCLPEKMLRRLGVKGGD